MENIFTGPVSKLNEETGEYERTMKGQHIRYLTLLGFLGALETITYFVSTRIPMDFFLEYQWLLWVFLAPASFMAAKAINAMVIFEWLRKPFTKIVKHSSGAGEDAETRDDIHPVLQVFGDLITCPYCSGMWSAVGLLVLWAIEPRMGWLEINAIGAAGLGIFICRMVNMAEWIEHAFHETAGYLNRFNKREQGK